MLRVNPGFEWPSRRETVNTSTPLRSHADAAEWRSVWNVTDDGHGIRMLTFLDRIRLKPFASDSDNVRIVGAPAAEQRRVG